MSSLVLRPSQDKAIDLCRQSIANGNKRVLLYGPTGFGKTEIAISLLRQSAEKNKRSAIIMDRVVLCQQTSVRLDKYGVDHGVIQAGSWRWRPQERIQVCSAQTLEKLDSIPLFDLLIIDEAHCQRQGTVAYIKNNNVPTIGLSASPFTKGLGSVYQDIITPVTTSELVGEGSLVPLRVFISKEIDMTDAKKVAGEWSQSEATQRGIKITGDIVSEWVKKTNQIFGKPEKTIVFCAGVAHGSDLQEKFAQAGYNFVSISYKDDDEFKQDAIKEFEKPDSSIHGLIATDILTKGFDVPDVKIGISARPFTKSLSSHVQQMGRVMRPCFGKEFALWLDHSGNYLRFKEDWEELYCHGVSILDDGKEKPKKEPTKAEKESAKCPKCSHLWPHRTDICPCCGYVKQKNNDVIVKSGELVELGDTLKKEADYRRSFFHQLLTYQDSKPHYKPSWARVKYREKFGEWPRFAEGREPLTGGVSDWIKSRFIKFANRKSK